MRHHLLTELIPILFTHYAFKHLKYLDQSPGLKLTPLKINLREKHIKKILVNLSLQLV